MGPDESEYRKEDYNLIECCHNSNFVLNISKSKELILTSGSESLGSVILPSSMGQQ